MFTTRNIEANLRAVTLDSSDEKRMARCTLHVPLTYDLAKQLSPRIADSLYRLSQNQPHKRNEYMPHPEITSMRFHQAIPPQRFEFRSFADQASPVGVFYSVEVVYLEAIKLKGQEQFTLVLGLLFEIADRHTATEFIIDRFKQTLYARFEPMQQGLKFEEAETVKAHRSAR